MVDNRYMLPATSQFAGNKAKRLRLCGHNAVHAIVRKAGPILGQRISSCLLRYPIVVLTSFIVCLFCFLTLLMFTTFPIIFIGPRNVLIIPSSHEAVELVPANMKLDPLRIIFVVTPLDSVNSIHGSSVNDKDDSLRNLFSSLHDSDYDDNKVDMEIIVLPHDDDKVFNSTYSIISSFHWPHGALTVTNATSGGRHEKALIMWEPPRDIPDAVAIIESSRAAPLSREWYRFVTSARLRYRRRAEIIAFAVEPVRPRGDVVPSAAENQDPDVFLWEGVYDKGVLVLPSPEKWRSFQRWYQRQRNNWFLWPTIIGQRDKRDERWAKFQSNVRAPWTLWFSRFSALYGVYTLYPRHDHPSPLSLPQSRGMLRNNGLLRFSLDASIVSHGETGSRISDATVHTIVDLGRRHGGAVSLTVLNSAFIDTALSWICNVDVGGFRPPGIVWITTDDESYEVLKDVPGSFAVHVSEMNGGKRGTSFGTPGYWLLMLERTLLIRDILNHGVGVFLFETDQVWLRDPVPSVSRLLRSGDDVDIVGTIDSSHDIAGNFLYLNPTLETRRVWDEVSQRFEYAYDSHNLDNLSKNSRTIIDNDQTLLTKLVLSEEPFRSRYPTVFRALDTELFVAGRWYDGGKRFYATRKSRSPILINNNFIEGIAKKTHRLKKHGHWFLKGGKCDGDRVRTAIKENEYRAIKAGLTKTRTASSKPTVLVGIDVEADMEMAITAVSFEREDAQTAMLDLRPTVKEQNAKNSSNELHQKLGEQRVPLSPSTSQFRHHVHTMRRKRKRKQ